MHSAVFLDMLQNKIVIWDKSVSYHDFRIYAYNLGTFFDLILLGIALSNGTLVLYVYYFPMQHSRQGSWQ